MTRYCSFAMYGLSSGCHGGPLDDFGRGKAESRAKILR